jgi:hypothetical protein
MNIFLKIENFKLKILGHSGQEGYIALMSSIIIAGVLMAVVFTMSFKSFMTRFNILDMEYKSRSLNYAETCANTAILKVIENNAYTGETISFGTESCTVTVTGTYVINAKSSVPQANANKAVSNIQITLDSAFSVTNRKEVANF